MVWQIKIQEKNFDFIFFVFMYIAYDRFYEIALVIDYLFCIFDCVSSKIWLIGALLRCNHYLIFIVVSGYLRINVKKISNELIQQYFWHIVQIFNKI
jgi:hypothetical protein